MTLHDAAKRLAMDTELGAHAPALITLKRWSAARYLEGAKHFLPGRHHPLYNYAVIKEFCLQRLPVRDFTAVSYPPPVRPLLAPEAAPSEPVPAPAAAQAPVEPEPPPTAHKAITPQQPLVEQSSPDDVPPASPTPSGAQLLDLHAAYQVVTQDLARNRTFQAQILGSLQDLSSRMEAFGTQIAKLSSVVSDLEHTRKTLMVRYDGEMTSLRTRLEQMQGAVRDNPGLDVAAARLGQAAYRIEAALQELRPAEQGLAPSLARTPTSSTAPTAPTAPAAPLTPPTRAPHPGPTFFDEED